MERRNFINLFFGGSFVGTLAAFLYPVIRYIIPPKQVEVGAKSVNAAKIGELAPGAHKIFKFGSIPGILINTQEGELRAFSAVCTHLTCTVVYEADGETILCPCHNGRFDLNGNVVAGPPPGPLESLHVEVSGEDIIVSKET